MLLTVFENRSNLGSAWVCHTPWTLIWIAQALKQLPGLVCLAAKFWHFSPQEQFSTYSISVLKSQESHRLCFLVREIQVLDNTWKKDLLINFKHIYVLYYHIYVLHYQTKMNKMKVYVLRNTSLFWEKVIKCIFWYLVKCFCVQWMAYLILFYGYFLTFHPIVLKYMLKTCSLQRRQKTHLSDFYVCWWI